MRAFWLALCSCLVLTISKTQRPSCHTHHLQMQIDRNGWWKRINPSELLSDSYKKRRKKQAQIYQPKLLSDVENYTVGVHGAHSPHAVDSCWNVTGELLTGPASARRGSLPPNVALRRPVVGHNLDLCYNGPTLKLPPKMSCPVADVDPPLHGAAIRTLSGHISLELTPLALPNATNFSAYRFPGTHSPAGTSKSSLCTPAADNWRWWESGIFGVEDFADGSNSEGGAWHGFAHFAARVRKSKKKNFTSWGLWRTRHNPSRAFRKLWRIVTGPSQYLTQF